MIVFHGSLLNYLQDGSTIQSHYISNPLQPFLPFRLSSDPMCLAGSPRPLSAAFYSTRTALRPSIGHLIAVCRIVRRRRAVARRPVDQTADGTNVFAVCWQVLASLAQGAEGEVGGIWCQPCMPGYLIFSFWQTIVPQKIIKTKLRSHKEARVQHFL